MAEHCPHVRYLLKSDKDMFINVPHLVRVLRGRSSTGDDEERRSILGLIHTDGPVRRTGRYAVRPDEYPLTLYPSYARGGAYVIANRQLSRELYETSEFVPPVRMEDVYVTGVLSRVVGGVRFVSLPGFNVPHRKRPTTGCDVVSGRTLTATGVAARQIRSVWRQTRQRYGSCLKSANANRFRPSPSREQLAAESRR